MTRRSKCRRVAPSAAAARPRAGVVAEPVERRTMMSAAVLANDVLTVTGTAAADTISVKYTESEVTAGNLDYTVTVNGVTQTFANSAAMQLVINAGDGNDSVALGGDLRGNESLSPLALTSVVVNGGDGDDTIGGGQIAGDNSSEPIPSVSVSGGAGDDTIDYEGDDTVTLDGGDGNDKITADNFAFIRAIMYGDAGNDTLIASGDDTAATMSGGDGDDSFYNDQDYDDGISVSGGAGTDTVYVGQHVDQPVIDMNGSTAYFNYVIDSDVENVDASAGNLTIVGNALDNTITVDGDTSDGSEPVTLMGGDGNDVLSTNEPATLSGGAGNDTLIGSAAGDAYSGGAGTDLVDYSARTDNLFVYLEGGQASGDAADPLDSFDGTVEQVYGGSGNDDIYGTAGNNALYGNAGNDTLHAFGGTDALFGGPGNDTVFCADGGPTYVDGGPGTDAATIDATGDTTVNVESVTKVPTPTPTPTTTTTQLTGTTYGTSGSYANSGNTIAKATDGSLSTYFDSAQANGSAVGIDLGSARVVSQIKFAPRSGYASRMVGGVFQASSDVNFASNVVTVYTVSATPASGSLTAVPTGTTTAYRYWRYVGPNGGYGNIAEFQLFGAATSTPTPTATKLTGALIGTTGSYANSGDTIAKAVDGSLSTYFDSAAATGSWVGYDLGTAATVASVSFAPRSGYESRIVGGVFQGSDSPQFTSGVVNLYTVTAAPKAGVLTTAAVTASGSFRYVRYLSPSNGYANVAEVNFFGTSGTAGVAAVRLAGTTGGTSGSYADSGNTVAKATDGNLNTFFDSAAANGSYVQIDLGTDQAVTQIAFAPRSGYAARMVGGVFEASDDATFATGVATVYTVKAQPASGSLTTVPLSAAADYRYWRYVSPANGYANIAEFQLFE